MMLAMVPLLLSRVTELHCQEITWLSPKCIWDELYSCDRLHNSPYVHTGVSHYLLGLL